MTELVVDGVEAWLGALHVLKGTSFQAKRGAIVALLGASGSGKTTLLRCVAGLEQPEVGQIVIGGTTVLDLERGIALPPEKRNVGLVFQSYALWPHRTVMENVGYGLKLRGVGQAERQERVRSRPRPRWGLRICRSDTPHSSPVGSSSAWRSAGRWSMSRVCCS